MHSKILIPALLYLLVFPFIHLHAQEAKPVETAEDLAEKLSNPIASLISVPCGNTALGYFPPWKPLQ